MNTVNCIKTRRSIRKFLDKEIPDEIIRKIIELAQYSPSSRDSQPWEFIVIKDSETKKKLVEIKEKENEDTILGAKIIIIVCVDKKRSEIRWIEDGTCATMNILLAAHDLGLGAVYVTGYSNTKPESTVKIKELLNLPESVIPVTIIPIGYPDESEKLDDKQLRKTDELIHLDKW